jgi:hypothetical protein
MTLEQRKAAVKAAIEPVLATRAEIGLNDLRRRLHWSLREEPLGQDGRFVAKMLNALGWHRDGWLGTGYDREARYVPAQEPCNG